MATIKEIALKAGVSIGTVDRVLHNRGMVNAQTKERVEAVMRELNYRPNQAAQGLAARKKKLRISFFLPNIQHHPFFEKVAHAAEKKAKDSCYNRSPLFSALHGSSGSDAKRYQL